MEREVKILKIQKKNRGYFFRIPSEVIPELDLENRDRARVYIDKERRRIIYELL